MCDASNRFEIDFLDYTTTVAVISANYLLQFGTRASTG
jgi:hypothetical protein